MSLPNTDLAFPPGPAIYPQAVVLILLSGITLILDVAPFIWHAKSKNLAACALIFWIFAANLFNFINPIIWPNDDIENQWKGYGLCDVEVKITVGSYFGAVGALAAILRNLSQVMDTRKISLVPTTKQKRINDVVSGVLCFGLPVLSMIVHYLVSPFRYYLFTVSGCFPAQDSSWLTLITLDIGAFFVSLLAVYYAVILCFRIYRYKTEFGQLVAISKTTKARFMRLFILCSILILILLPVQLYNLVKSLQFGVHHYSFALDHGPYYNDVQIIPSSGVVVFDRWINVTAGFLVFFFFGIGDDAIKMYKGWLLAVGLGRIFPSLKNDSKGGWKGWSFAVGSWGTFNDRARSLFKKRNAETGEEETYASGSGPRAGSVSTAGQSSSLGSPQIKESFTGKAEKDAFAPAIVVTREIYSSSQRDLEK